MYQALLQLAESGQWTKNGEFGANARVMQIQQAPKTANYED